MPARPEEFRLWRYRPKPENAPRLGDLQNSSPERGNFDTWRVHSERQVPKPTGWLVNCGGDGALGRLGLRSELTVPQYQRLTWAVMDPSLLPTDVTDGEVIYGAVVDEHVWGRVVGQFTPVFSSFLLLILFSLQ